MIRIPDGAAEWPSMIVHHNQCLMKGGSGLFYNTVNITDEIGNGPFDYAWNIILNGECWAQLPIDYEGLPKFRKVAPVLLS